MKKVIGIVLLGFILASSGYGQNRDGRSVGSFERIKVSQGIEVELTKGSKEEVEVYARGVDLDQVITEVRGETLRIYLDGHRFRNVDVQVEVTFTELEGLIVSSAADVYSNSKIEAVQFDIEVSSAGSVDLDLDVESLDISVSSSGSAELKGQAESVDFDASSAGSIRAYELEAKDAYVRASSAGSVRISVTNRIDARASSAGTVRYRGNPDKEYTSSSSGGSVRRSN